MDRISGLERQSTSWGVIANPDRGVNMSRRVFKLEYEGSSHGQPFRIGNLGDTNQFSSIEDRNKQVGKPSRRDRQESKKKSLSEACRTEKKLYSALKKDDGPKV